MQEDIILNKNSVLDQIKWGGSGIERVTFDFIRERIPEGSTIIELGAGHVSTYALSQFYDLYSVEHNLQFTGLYPSAKYIFAPIENDWYDLKELPPAKMVLVDGACRAGILKHLHLFEETTKFLIHDTYRETEKKLAIDLGIALNRPVEFFSDGDFFAWI